MKNICLTILTLFLFDCSDPSSASKKGKVSLTFIGASSSEAQLLLRNNTPDTLTYFGFSPSSPLKTIEILSDTGWVISVWDWCGTGAEMQTVIPYGSVIISGPVIRKHVKTRLAFSYSFRNNEEYRKLVSDEYLVR